MIEDAGYKAAGQTAMSFLQGKDGPRARSRFALEQDRQCNSSGTVSAA